MVFIFYLITRLDMGLFSSDTYYCGICGNETQDTNCPSCGTAYHYRCLKNNGHVKKEGNLIRSDDYKIKCPDCGHVGKKTGIPALLQQACKNLSQQRYARTDVAVLPLFVWPTSGPRRLSRRSRSGQRTSVALDGA
jgi:predicted RNA-binding Zn-ribbon protein involved in translation (DUF1610 family)